MRGDRRAGTTAAAVAVACALVLGGATPAAVSEDLDPGIDGAGLARSDSGLANPYQPYEPPPGEIPTCNGVAATIVAMQAGASAGTAGDDVIVAGPGAQAINAGAGDDLICGGEDGDNIRGGSGSDTVLGEPGADRLTGDAGSDLLVGASEGDNLSGGGGVDTLRGSDGDDRLNGGAGRDRCSSGPGRDLVKYCGRR